MQLLRILSVVFLGFLSPGPLWGQSHSPYSAPQHYNGKGSRFTRCVAVLSHSKAHVDEASAAAVEAIREPLGRGVESGTVRVFLASPSPTYPNMHGFIVEAEASEYAVLLATLKSSEARLRKTGSFCSLISSVAMACLAAPVAKASVEHLWAWGVERFPSLGDLIPGISSSEFVPSLNHLESAGFFGVVTTLLVAVGAVLIPHSALYYLQEIEYQAGMSYPAPFVLIRKGLPASFYEGLALRSLPPEQVRTEFGWLSGLDDSLRVPGTGKASNLWEYDVITTRQEQR
jgi:hypothetical protein